MRTQVRATIQSFLMGMRRAPWWAMLGYAAAWVAVFPLSCRYWFLPAGVRVAALWLTSARRWPWLAGAEWLVLAALAPSGSTHATLAANALALFMPWFVYAAAVHEVRRATRTPPLPGDASLVILIGAALIAAMVNGALLTLFVWLDDGELVGAVHTYFSFALGDFVGAITLAPVVVLVAQAVRGSLWRTPDTRLGLASLPLLGVAAALVPGMVPVEYRWAVLAVPLILTGAMLGCTVAVASVAMLGASLMALASMDTAGWPPEDVQRMLAVAGTSALLLGTGRDTARAQHDRLSHSIEELEDKTRALRDVAARLSDRSEVESRRLGVELHDQVGQDMTALATRLRIAQRAQDLEAMRAELQLLQQMVETAQLHLRSVIRLLHPIALERFGLERALARGPLAEIAADGGVHYECRLTGEPSELPVDVATHLYRICQEAVTNAVRHGSGGGAVLVELQAIRRPAGHDVELAIRDEDGPLSIDPSSTGVGLQGIRDRANALNATYHFNLAAGDPRHWLKMFVPRRGDGPRSYDERGGDSPYRIGTRMTPPPPLDFKRARPREG